MSGNPIIQILDLQFIELHNSLVTLDLSGLRHLSSFSKYGFGGLIQLKVSSNTILLEGQKHFEFYLIDRYIDWIHFLSARLKRLAKWIVI